MLSVLLGVLTFVLIARNKSVRPAQDVVSSIPALTSRVQGVEIVNAELSADSTGAPIIKVLVVNHTSKAVVELLLTSGGTGQALGGTREHPTLPAFGSVSATFNVFNLKPDEPLRLSAVVWEDGTSSGYPYWADGIFKKKVNERLEREAAQ